MEASKQYVEKKRKIYPGARNQVPSQVPIEVIELSEEKETIDSQVEASCIHADGMRKAPDNLDTDAQSVFKIFSTIWNSLLLLHLVTDFQICAALLNRFHISIESHQPLTKELETLMLSRLNG